MFSGMNNYKENILFLFYYGCKFVLKIIIGY